MSEYPFDPKDVFDEIKDLYSMSRKFSSSSPIMQEFRRECRNLTSKCVNKVRRLNKQEYVGDDYAEEQQERNGEQRQCGELEYDREKKKKEAWHKQDANELSHELVTDQIQDGSTPSPIGNSTDGRSLPHPIAAATIVGQEPASQHSHYVVLLNGNSASVSPTPQRFVVVDKSVQTDPPTPPAKTKKRRGHKKGGTESSRKRRAANGKSDNSDSSSEDEPVAGRLRPRPPRNDRYANHAAPNRKRKQQKRAKTDALDSTDKVAWLTPKLGNEEALIATQELMKNWDHLTEDVSAQPDDSQFASLARFEGIDSKPLCQLIQLGQRLIHDPIQAWTHTVRHRIDIALFYRFYQAVMEDAKRGKCSTSLNVIDAFLKRRSVSVGRNLTKGHGNDSVVLDCLVEIVFLFPGGAQVTREKCRSKINQAVQEGKRWHQLMQIFGSELFLLVPPDVKQHRLTLTDRQFTSLISAWEQRKGTMDENHLAIFQTAIKFTFMPLIQRQMEPIDDDGTFSCSAFVGVGAVLDHERNERPDVSEQFGTASNLADILEQSVAEDDPPNISEQFGTVGDHRDILEQSVAEDDPPNISEQFGTVGDHRDILEQSVAEDDLPDVSEQFGTAGDLLEILEQPVAEDDLPDVSEQFGTAGNFLEILERSMAEDDFPKIPEQSVTEERCEHIDEESLFKSYTSFGDPSE